MDTRSIMNNVNRSAVTHHQPVQVYGHSKCEVNDNGNTSEAVIRDQSSHAVANISNELSVRGQLSNCSLSDIMNRPGVVMLTTTNLGFVDMTLNMLESIKRVGVCVNTTIIAEDQISYEYLHKRALGDPGVRVLKTDSGVVSTAIRRYSRGYFALFNKRQAYVLALLKQHLNVLFTDVDTFWFRDPFSYFQGDFDMSMIDSKSPYPTRARNANFCAGFVYFKPTAATIQFVKAWIETMNNNTRTGRIRADQSVMNELLRADKPAHVKVQPLDTNIFPYGPKFYSLLAKKANYSTVMMHAASIRGHEAKMSHFKSSNMWLVNVTNEDMLATLQH